MAPAQPPARLEAQGPWRRDDGMVVIGVRFVMAPKWHIYWANPGDSGLPPKFEAALPEGWKLAQTHFPRPEILKSEEGTTIGYEAQAVILLVLESAPGARGGSATVASSYLVCREVCIAGEGEVRLELPAADALAALPPLPAVIDGRSYPKPLSSLGGRAEIDGDTIRISGRLPPGLTHSGCGQENAAASNGEPPSVHFLPFDLMGFSVPGGLVTRGMVSGERFQIEVAASLEPNDAPAQGLYVGGLVTFGPSIEDPCVDFTLQVHDPGRPKEAR